MHKSPIGKEWLQAGNLPDEIVDGSEIPIFDFIKVMGAVRKRKKIKSS